MRGSRRSPSQAAARLQPRPRKHAPTFGRNAILGYDPHAHMARCLTELGRYPAAVVQLRFAMRAGVTPRPRLEELRQRIEHEVARRLAAPTPAPAPAPPPADGRLSVASEPAGARVAVDGVPVGTTPLADVAVTPGRHVVRIEADGHAAEEESITVAAGGSYTLDRSLRPLATPTRPPRPAATATPAVARPAAGREATAPPAVVPPAIVPAATAAQAAGAAPEAPPAEPAATVPTPQPARGSRRAATILALGAIASAAFTVAATALVWRRRRMSPAYTPTRVIDTTPTHIKAGQTLGAYELTGLLGRGGMATTYSATRTADGSLVALKVPHEGCFVDPTYLARFLREGRLGEQLHHPRIVRVFEANEHEGRPFLAMELIAGHTLKQELRERGPFAIRRAVEIAADIAEALDYAHVKGVVHRDLKPENVMLLPDGSIKVMDFGIARLEGQEGLTSSQFFLGTPLYAAPEMIEPKSIDHAGRPLLARHHPVRDAPGRRCRSLPTRRSRSCRCTSASRSRALAELRRRCPRRSGASSTRLCAKQPGGALTPARRRCWSSCTFGCERFRSRRATVSDAGRPPPT